MTKQEALTLIFSELATAEIKHPGWPDDVVHGAAIVGEEAGELLQAALNYKYQRSKNVDSMRLEAAQTAAMGIRFLVYLAGETDGED